MPPASAGGASPSSHRMPRALARGASPGSRAPTSVGPARCARIGRLPSLDAKKGKPQLAPIQRSAQTSDRLALTVPLLVLVVIGVAVDADFATLVHGDHEVVPRQVCAPDQILVDLLDQV